VLASKNLGQNTENRNRKEKGKHILGLRALCWRPDWLAG
jgi:hypothetical protein